MTALTPLDPPTMPHGLPVVRSAPVAIPTPAPVAIYTGDADDEPDLEAALLVRRIARQKGLPRPFRTEPFPGQVVLSLWWPHLLQWIEMLDGFGCAEERERPDFDATKEDMPAVRVAALPHYSTGDFSVHGWIDVDDVDGGTRHQQFVLTPVNERDCQRCVELPEPARQPLSTEAWFADAWWRLVGKRWEEETGPRAHLIDDEVERPSQAELQPSPRRRAVTAS